MTIELKTFTSHLGDHDKTDRSVDHRLSRPERGFGGGQLPFVSFHAINQERAERFIRRMNRVADQFQMDALDLANLVYAAEALVY